jgi:hypothetical protein
VTMTSPKESPVAAAYQGKPGLTSREKYGNEVTFSISGCTYEDLESHPMQERLSLQTSVFRGSGSGSVRIVDGFDFDLPLTEALRFAEDLAARARYALDKLAAREDEV